MEQNAKFYQTVVKIALPVTLQSLLQSSFSVVDQLMIGRLGSSSIAGVGLAAKFASLYSVLLAAIATAAGIMLAQYIGQKQDREVGRSFFANLFLSVGLAVVFIVLCTGIPKRIMWLYTKEAATRDVAAGYLRILALSYLPMAISSICATMLRCMEAAVYPLYAGIIGAVCNTGLNYVLIFGKLGFARMDVKGAAVATVISQFVTGILTFLFLMMLLKKQDRKLPFLWRFDGAKKLQYLGILCPIIVCEFFWSLGENVYTAIYGNIGTDACAAMTLTIPIQTLVIGALSGLAQAAGIIIGKSLGQTSFEKAYAESKKLMLYGIGGSIILSLLLVFTGSFYVKIYAVEEMVQAMAYQLLIVFALVSPVKVQNMILGGGILRSGGKTKYLMWIDIIGTWCFGVPAGLLAAFVWKMSIPYVYLLLSMEECVRLAISLVLFRKKKWMRSLE